MHWVLLIAASGALLGAWLLRLGLVGRRIGTTPFCRKCGYNLTGIAHDRCPECGHVLSLPRAITVGERRRRRGLLWCGALLTILAGFAVAVVGYDWAVGINWYQYAPNWYVIRDIADSDRNVSWRALSEIRRRRAIRELPSADHNRLTNAALSEPVIGLGVTFGPLDWSNAFLAEAYSRNWLDEVQLTAFVDRLIDQLTRGTPAQRVSALSTIEDCRAAHELPGTALRRLIELTATLHAADNLQSEVSNHVATFLGAMDFTGRLSDDEQSSFRSNLLKVTLELPTEIAEGERPNCTITWQSRCPEDWAYTVIFGGIVVDGIPDQLPFGRWSGSGSFGKRNWAARPIATILPPGRHTIEVKAEIQVEDRTEGNPGAIAILKRTEVLIGHVQVLPDSSE